MKEEKTQGIDTETTAKDRHNTGKKAKEAELLDLRAGYCQHTSPNQVPTTFNFLTCSVKKIETYQIEHVKLLSPILHII